jgi:flagellar basal-body rod protein FlgF
MLQGFEIAAAAMQGRMDQQDVISNNLANANSTGYKRKVAVFSSFDEQLNNTTKSAPSAQQTVQHSAPSIKVYEDSRAGEIELTGTPTDIALDGAGSFVIEKNGTQGLTRNGSFRLNNTGQLVTSEGSTVMGERGAIQISGKSWSVDAQGNVLSDGQVIDKLKIEGSSNTKVVSSSLENSNVNTVEEMISMIDAMRSYEACQKAIKSLDQTLDKAINQMGRVA